MSALYNQHDINKLIERIDHNIEFEISYRKSEDIIFSSRDSVFNHIVLAATDYIENKHAISTRLLAFVDSVFVDDAASGHYEIMINTINLPMHDVTTLTGHVFNKEFEVSVIQEDENGDILSHDSPLVVMRCNELCI